MSKSLTVACYGIRIRLFPRSDGVTVGRIVSSDLLRLPVDSTDRGDCEFDAAMTAVEAVVLGHACAGVDVTTKAYAEGIRTAVEACENHLL